MTPENPVMTMTGADAALGYGLEIRADTACALRAALDDYRERSEVSLAALLDEGGLVLASSAAACGAWQGRIDSMGALAAGVFASMRELARQAGETGFRECVQHGRTQHLHLQVVAPDFLLLSVFGSGVAPGLVRHYAGETEARLRECAGRIRRVWAPGSPGARLPEGRAPSLFRDQGVAIRV